jgi:hypothetical protein
MKLKYYEEIVGTLKEIQEKNDQLHLTFVFEKTLEIPPDALPLEKLNKCKNKKIGILFTGEKYLMRTLIGKSNTKK